MIRLSELNNDQINYLNIVLMAVSGAIAFVLPFELFLFSYAILGPLHYLTEIGWLHRKNYFTRGKYDFLFLSLLCFLVFYFTFVKPSENPTRISGIFTFGLIASLIFVFIKDNLYRIVLFVLALIGIALTEAGETNIIWAGIFLPTLIHVFVFTWAFMMYGVLKNKSFSGFLSVIMLLLIGVGFFFFKAPALQYEVSEAVSSRYRIFTVINSSLIDLFNLAETGNGYDPRLIFSHNAGFLTMRFIAFAYTYHYLNWFSKTSIIKWHKVSKKTLAITTIIWLFSVSLYVFDYVLGVKALFFLSFLHVFLEFPLNVTSIHGIAKSLTFGGKGR